RRRDERVHISDEPRPMRRAKLAAKLGVAFHDGVGKEIRSDLAEELAQLYTTPHEIRQTFEMLDELAIHENAGGRFTSQYPGTDNIDRRPTIVEIRGE